MSEESSPVLPVLAALPQATPERPWLGLAHFSEADCHYFYGRDTEIREMMQHARQASLTVLYGISGYGKSSLLGAGLISALRSEGHPVVLLRRCYDELGSRPLQGDVIAEFVKNIPGCVPPSDGTPLTLWEFFHDRSQPWFERRKADFDSDSENVSSWPVLLLDQFEEIFIRGEDRSTGDAAGDARAKKAAVGFMLELADLVENRPPALLRERLLSGSTEDRRTLLRRFDFQTRPVRVVVAIRDDFLARLERWRRAMPALMEHRLELRLLAGPQAFKSVFEPGDKRPGQPPILPENIAADIVRAAAGAPSGIPLEEIDAVPPILSLLCERLNEHRLSSMPVPASVTETDFTGGEADRILARFYDDKLRSHPRALTEFLEDELVSDSGFRENVTVDSAIFGLLPRVPDAQKRLGQLVDERLLVIEDRGGVSRIEFTHDTLARLALERRATRQARSRRTKAIGWTVVSTLIAGVSLGLTFWALSEKRNSDAATRLAEKEEQQTKLQRDRAESLVRQAAQADLGTARQLVEGNKRTEALCYLARALRFDPDLRLGAVEYAGLFLDEVRSAPPLPDFSFDVSERNENFTQTICALAMHPNGGQIAISDREHGVRIRETATGKEVAKSEVLDGYVDKLSYSADGLWLVWSGKYLPLEIREAATLNPAEMDPKVTENLEKFWFNPKGYSGCAMLGSGELCIVPLGDRNQGAEMLADTVGDYPMEWSSDGRFLAVLGSKGKVKVFDTAEQKIAVRLLPTQGSITSVHFSSDGSMLGTANTQGEIFFWDGATGAAASPVSRIGSAPATAAAAKSKPAAKPTEAGISSSTAPVLYDFAFAPEGLVWSLSLSQKDSKDYLEVECWHLAKGERVYQKTLEIGEDEIYYLGRDGHVLFCGQADGRIELYRLSGATGMAKQNFHQIPAERWTLDPNSRWLAAAFSLRQGAVWDLRDALAPANPSEPPVTALPQATSPDGSSTILYDANSDLRLLDTATHTRSGLRLPPNDMPTQYRGHVDWFGWDSDGHRVLQDSLTGWRSIAFRLSPKRSGPWLSDLTLAGTGNSLTVDGEFVRNSYAEALRARERLRQLFQQGASSHGIQDPEWRALISWWLTPPTSRPRWPVVTAALPSANPPTGPGDFADSFPRDSFTKMAHDSQAYLDELRARFAEHWKPPRNESDESFSATVEIGVDKNGTLARRRIAVSSGNKEMDDSVLLAITQINRVEPVPDALSKHGVNVSIKFLFAENGRAVVEDNSVPGTPSKEIVAEEGFTTETSTRHDNKGSDASDAKKLLFPAIHFDRGEAKLTRSARDGLETVARFLKQNGKSVILAGFVDDNLGPKESIALGNKRAEAARDYLLSLGVEGSRVKTVSFGTELPLNPEATTEKDRAVNRRVEFGVTQ